MQQGEGARSGKVTSEQSLSGQGSCKARAWLSRPGEQPVPGPEVGASWLCLKLSEPPQWQTLLPALCSSVVGTATALGEHDGSLARGAVFPGLPAEELLWDPSPTTMGSPEGRFHFAIDRGGTFTDVFAQCPGGQVRVLKLLSEDPANYADAPTEGIRRILEQEAGMLLPRDRPLDSSHIASIRMGTTVATNALLERKGERVALLVTRGFRDLLHIGTQARGDLFDLTVPMPEVLYEEVLEVDERVVLHRGEAGTGTPVKGRTGDLLDVQQPVDLGTLRGKLEGLLSRGIRSLAVVLMHSYTWAQHEQQVGALARELGFSHVSLSSEAMPMVRIVPRGHTACADAYLTPAIQRYVQGFRRGFQGQLKDVQVLFMRSDGGLAPMDAFGGSRAVLSARPAVWWATQQPRTSRRVASLSSALTWEARPRM
uniref:5-oxoprolinase-like isoform X3 n=1 Tax=Macaca mulatta TaxID=9544 RepID=UPI0010A297B0|nr:5-oxoprolinase-like isoform X3 [Macaca mulatta]